MDSLIKDIRFAVRGLLKRPGFTVVAVLTLALGIGANTAIFSVVYSVLLKSPPFPRADRMVLLWGDDRTEGDSRSQVSHTDIVDYRAQQTLFESITTFNSWTPLLSGAGEPARINAALVGDDFFNVMGTQPFLGRGFLPEEQQEGKDQVVVLSHELWQRQLNSDPEAVGKSILLNLRPHTIVGVLPQSFHSLPATLLNKPALLYRPIVEETSESQRSARHLRSIGRLKEGVTIQQAQSELSVIAQRLEAQHPETNTNWGIHLVGLHEDTVRDLQKTLWVLLGAVAFVLLIACANVANLLLARSTQRAAEMTIRTALGASRARLLRQVLTESGLLALLGTAAGLLLAVWGVEVIKVLGSKTIPQLQTVELSLPALAFTFGLSLLTALLFGLGPAWQSSRPDLTEALKADGRGLGGGTRRTRLRSVLVVSEIAFALVLLMCAGLLIRTVGHLLKVDPGFEYANSLKMDLGLPALRYSTPEKRIEFYRELTTRVRSLPGVVSAGVITPLPVAGGFDSTGIDIEFQPTEPGREPMVDRYIMTPGYLQALNIPLKHGREITTQDDERAPLVLLVSEGLAARFWPNQDPIGKRIKLPWNPGREDEPWRTVVGVVGDVKQYGLDKPSTSAVYLPHAQYSVSFMTLVARTSVEPAEMLGTVKQVVQQLDPDQVPMEVATMQDVMVDSVRTQRFTMFVLAAFATLALALAAVGIYGVMSYVVAQRTHEIGIRIALGARIGNIFRLVMGNALWLALGGIALGAVGAFALTRLMKSLLFGVAPFDVTTFVVVSVALGVVALVASFLPARRATKIEPLVALRNE
ncbi:MAG TPA: ABC transporter permease [Pyrinomonadaceae bacterium]|nr:ABC transporter permease [Pyrinomonadaceae bacterium]